MKVLWVGDAGCSTGFARCTHAACDALHAKGHEVHVLGMNFFGDPAVHAQHPYPIYPSVNLADGGKDLFGEGRLPRMIKRVNPDVVVFLNDPWNIPQYLNRMLNELGGADVQKFEDLERPPLVGWLAVDACNQRGKNLNYLDHVVTWTEFGMAELRTGGYEGDGDIVGLGVDSWLFQPKPRDLARERVVPEHVPRDAYIVGAVGRNQPRKRLDLAIRYVAEWIHSFNVENAYLYLHVAPTGDSGCDLQSVATHYGISDRLILATPAVGVGAPEELMPWVYSSFNVYLTTTSGEGWGLPTLEAMACGVPTIVPDFAALGEWTGSASFRVSASEHMLNAPLNSAAWTVGAVPDREATVRALHQVYKDRALQGDLARRGLSLAQSLRWEDTGDEMVRILERLVGNQVDVTTIGGERKMVTAVPPVGRLA